MKRVIFHAGAPKTASTSIQNALSSNCKDLSRMGFYVPQSARGKHPELAFCSSFDLFDSYSTYANYLPRDFDDRSSILDYFRSASMAYINGFLSSNCHTLILSDELLPYYCNTREKIQKLRSLFPPSLDIHFLYYTRRPSDMYISLYSTLVKVNQTIVWPHQFCFPERKDDSNTWIVSPEMLDHNNFILNIKAVFGASSISVFPYSTVQRSPGYESPIKHFFLFLGIDEDLCDIECVSNPRLGYISLFVLCLSNYIARSLSRWRRTHACVVYLNKAVIIPVLESLSRIGIFKFPSKHILCSRPSFDNLFS